MNLLSFLLYNYDRDIKTKLSSTYNCTVHLFPLHQHIIWYMLVHSFWSWVRFCSSWTARSTKSVTICSRRFWSATPLWGSQICCRGLLEMSSVWSRSRRSESNSPTGIFELAISWSKLRYGTLPAKRGVLFLPLFVCVL